MPGVGIAKEPNLAAYAVANGAFLLGLFSFAAVLGAQHGRNFFLPHACTSSYSFLDLYTL